MKKQLLLKICAISAISIMAFSCKKTEVAKQQSILDNKKSDVAAGALVTDNVYVSGFYLYTTTPLARFWLNTSSIFNLSTGTGTTAYAYDIDVSSTGDSFTIGTSAIGSATKGVVWKNNVMTPINLPLPSGASSAEPRMVYANGSTIYIAGISWFSGSDHRATLWTIPLGNTALMTATVLGGSYTDAFGVTVTTAGDVYVAGNVSPSGGVGVGNVVYWKNGVQSSPLGSIQSTRIQIVSIGTDVYIGFATNSPAALNLYKNGVAMTAIPGGPTSSISYVSLATHGTDLYVSACGADNPSASVGKIWVWNYNAATQLQYIISSGPSTFITTGWGCLGVGALGDTYVAGYEGNVGCTWKNGTLTNLFGGTNNNITAIAVK